MPTTTEILLKYSVDNKQALAGTKQIIDGLGQLQGATAAETLLAEKLKQGLEVLDRGKALKQLALDAAAGVTPLDQVIQKLDQMNATDSELQKLSKDMDTFAASAQKAADATTQIASAPRGVRDIGVQGQGELPFPDMGGGDTSGGAAGGVLGNLRQSAIALPGVGYQSPLVVGLRVAEKAADATGASLLQLGIAGGIVVGAILLVKQAFDQFTSSIKEGKERVAAALTAQDDYYEALRNSTTEQVKATIATLDHNQALLKQQIAENANAIKSASTLPSTSLPLFIFDTIIHKSGDLVGATSDIVEKQKTLEQQYQAQEDTITRLSQGLENGAFAANTAAAQEELLKKAREETSKTNIALIEQDVATRQRLIGLRDTGAEQLQALQEAGGHNAHDLTDAVYAQIKANQDRAALITNVELPALARLNDGSEATFAKVHDLNVELVQLGIQNELIKTSVLDVVAARQNEINALQAQKDYSDEFNDSLQDVNKAQVAAGEAATKTADAYKALLAADTEHRGNLEDIQAKYDTATAEALVKKNDKLAAIDEQARARTLEQHQKDDLSIREAEATGNFARVQQILAQQRLDDKQRATQVDKQKDDADKTYNDQLKAAEKQNKSLLDSEAERFDKELDQRRAAYDKAVDDQRALNSKLESLRAESAFKDIYWVGVVTAAYDKVRVAQGAFTAQMLSDADKINQWIASGGAAWKNVDSTGWATTNGSGGGTSKPTNVGAHRPGEVVGLPAVTGTAASILLGNPVFGGYRAYGGDVAAGRGYIVGEKGPEWFAPRRDGYIVPNGGKGLSGDLNIKVHATGDSEANRAAATEIAIKVGNQVLKHVGKGIDQLAVN